MVANTRRLFFHASSRPPSRILSNRITNAGRYVINIPRIIAGLLTLRFYNPLLALEKIEEGGTCRNAEQSSAGKTAKAVNFHCRPETGKSSSQTGDIRRTEEWTTSPSRKSPARTISRSCPGQAEARFCGHQRCWRLHVRNGISYLTPPTSDCGHFCFGAPSSAG